MTELVNCFSGKEPKIVPNGSIPVVDIGGVSRYTDKPICNEPLIAIGDVFTVGKPRYFDYPVWITGTQIYLTNKRTDILELKYLFMFLETELNWDSFTDKFAPRPSVDKFRFLQKVIDLPPLKDQKDAVDYYNRLEEAETRELNAVNTLIAFKSDLMALMFPSVDDGRKNVVFDKL